MILLDQQYFLTNFVLITVLIFAQFHTRNNFHVYYVFVQGRSEVRLASSMHFDFFAGNRVSVTPDLRFTTSTMLPSSSLTTRRRVEECSKPTAVRRVVVVRWVTGSDFRRSLRRFEVITP